MFVFRKDNSVKFFCILNTEPTEKNSFARMENLFPAFYSRPNEDRSLDDLIRFLLSRKAKKRKPFLSFSVLTFPLDYFLH